jgi:hypothetical protein
MPDKRRRSRKQLERDLLATQLAERRIAVLRQAFLLAILIIGVILALSVAFGLLHGVHIPLFSPVTSGGD